MELLSLLIGTVLLRPYVFIFLALVVFVASQQIGWTRTLIWTVTGYAVAFAAEFSSIHSGFPFGGYYYIDTTRSQELWIAGVPFMDSLSFVFLTFTGYSCAWQLVAALKGRTRALDVSAYHALRRSPAVLVIGALITALMDVIIDPVALMGERWFLGQIYGYEHTGIYFGIPWTNFAGWALVSAVTIGLNQALDAWIPGPGPWEHRSRGIPYAHLGGFMLFVFVVGFNLFMTLWLGEYLLLGCGLALVLAFLLISWRILAGRAFLAPCLTGRDGCQKLSSEVP